MWLLINISLLVEDYALKQGNMGLLMITLIEMIEL